MPSISITNPEYITELTLGASSVPKVGGDVDLSKFAKLKEFRATGLDLNSVVGFENLPELKIFNVQENILSSDPLPTLVNTSIFRMNISDAEIGPSTVADGWAIPSTVQKWRADNTNLGGAKREILTAFYHAFKDVDPVEDYDNKRSLSVQNSGVDAPDDDTYLTGDHTGVTVGDAKAKLASIGFILYGF